jgi:ATP-binding cassette subfamily B (MDR/TAP) protein 1
LKHTAEGGSLAEEVISTVRTAKAFGIQFTLQGLYNKFMDRALAVDLKSAYWQGGGFAFFFFVVYAAYGLGQYFIVLIFLLSHSFPYSL